MFDTDRERAALVSVAAPWMGPSVLAPVLDAADLWTIGYSVLPGVAAPPEPVSYSAVGDLRAAVAVAAPTTFGAGAVSASTVGDLRAVVALAAITTGPGGGAITGGRAVITLPMRWVVEGDLGVVVGLTARTGIQRARPRAVVPPPVPRHHTVRADIGLHATLTSRARFHDVIEADDEDVLVLLGGRSS